MRTTVDLDKNLLDEVVTLTNEANRSRALNKAMKEYVRQKRLQELYALAGNIELVDNLKELEELDLEELRQSGQY